MPDTMKDGGSLEVAFARFEGSVSAEIKNLAHDVKSLAMSLAAFATTKDVSVLEKRVESLETSQTWLIRTVVGAIITASVTAGIGAFVYFVKGGHL